MWALTSVKPDKAFSFVPINELHATKPILYYLGSLKYEIAEHVDSLSKEII